jgi:succinyl-CoA synthetase beta subunit
MDIETVAVETPHKVKTLKIDIVEGLSSSAAKDLAKFMEFDGPTVDQVNYSAYC